MICFPLGVARQAGGRSRNPIIVIQIGDDLIWPDPLFYARKLLFFSFCLAAEISALCTRGFTIICFAHFVLCVCTFVFYDYVFLLRKIYHCTALFPGHPGLTFYESFHVGLFFLFLGGRYPARAHSSCLTFNPARFGWADHHHAIRFDKLLVLRLNTSIWSLYTVFLGLILFFPTWFT